MKTKVYFLEIVYYLETDKEDNERVEYRLGDSFWCNRRKLQRAKKRIVENLNEGWRIAITHYDIVLRKGQKYLYILNYEYYAKDGTCYFYSFYPQTSYKKCHTLKKDILTKKEHPFDSNSNRVRIDEKWFVEKYEIVY